VALATAALIAPLMLAGCGRSGSGSAAGSHRGSASGAHSASQNGPVTAQANVSATIAPSELLTIGQPKPVQPIRPGFVGLSLEYTAIEPYAGTDPSAVNPVLVQLIRNLAPGQAPVLRIGGDTTDWTWVPVSDMSRPRGIRYALNTRWLNVTRALTRALGVRLIMGLDLEANSLRLASAEAQVFETTFGRRAIEALEPGNEPELYGSWAWYLANGIPVAGRPADWDFSAYTQNFSSVARTLHALPIAGPSTGSDKWIAYLSPFLHDELRVSLATLHRYPLQACYTPLSSPKYPTIAHLLSPSASLGLASSVAGNVAVAHAHHVQLRIDEINTNSCGSAPQVTGTFASALWALDTMFALANVGIDGVNVHTYPLADYRLFNFRQSAGSWQGRVQPEYYGLMMFALAAPPGSRPLRLSGPGKAGLRTWATSGPDGRVRTVLIDDSATRARTVVIRSTTNRPATLIRLQAPSLSSSHGITLAGQSFGSTTSTGLLAGTERTITIKPASGVYSVYVPPASAALLTLP